MNHTATASRFCSTRGRWSALNIVLMIIGFAVFWPLGLAMLAWIVWGDEIGRRTSELKDQFRSFSDRAASFRPGAASHTWRSDTGNVAFDEYRERELKRIEEERRKLDEMRGEFESFLKELRRVKDQEEFDRFMNNYRNRTSAAGETV
ncbi:MAG TPA: DUF2852 domain-containing protein [Candidatus Synoicihabitans sp.]|nr:DUF2852 domain-containing protein [Candidatus Synoicihabitans sp.]